MLCSDSPSVKGAEHCEVGEGDGVFRPIPELALLYELDCEAGYWPLDNCSELPMRDTPGLKGVVAPYDCGR